MRISRSGRFERTDIWREGKWLDLWSVVHLLSGMSIGFALYPVHFGAIASVIIVLLGLTSYELWEMAVQIKETPMNRCMDVVVGMTGFLPIFFLLAPRLTQTWFILTFGFILTANIVMSTFGWIASQKAAELKVRTRARYLRERKKLQERAEQMSEKYRSNRVQ
jgi:hypothetical protein